MTSQSVNHKHFGKPIHYRVIGNVFLPRDLFTLPVTVGVGVYIIFFDKLDLENPKSDPLLKFFYAGNCYFIWRGYEWAYFELRLGDTKFGRRVKYLRERLNRVLNNWNLTDLDHDYCLWSQKLRLIDIYFGPGCTESLPTNATIIYNTCNQLGQRCFPDILPWS